MKQGNSAAKSATRKQGKASKGPENDLLTDQTREKVILDTWANANIHAVVNKKTNTASVKTRQTHHSSETQAYVLREMPTPVHLLTLETLCRKICQDIFLKAELMQGHQVTYVPAWETYPLWIEEQVIAAAKSKSPLKLSVLRKRCRARHKQELEIQKQKFYQLGIFADWDTSQKTLESRQEARLIALISRLRDSDYLHDLPQLSPWCPKCTIPLNEANLIQMPTKALNGYVKFPFNVGLEAFGTNVFFAVQLPYLREIAWTTELGINENTTYWLTQFADEFLLFAEPQLKNFCRRLAKGQQRPKRVKEIKAVELTQYTVAHPLFPSKALNITLVPQPLPEKLSNSQPTPFLKSGVLPLNPAHDQLSYDLAQELNIASTPIFDETGRLTEEAGQLCGLYLFDAEKFIIPQLERFGYLLKTYNEERRELHCPRCEELAVFRPCSKWVFSVSNNHATFQLLNAQDHWDNYANTEHKNIADVRKAVSNFRDLQVSAQRQWGMPLPILLCDQCDEPLTDKNTLSAIRNSIQRGFESWFRLSVEELLPTDTHCSNCDSSEFRKEATLIDGHFANLLQTIDNSDFKKALGGSTSVMFVPQPSTSDAEWIKWLAEISVISAALTRSRPIKEIQPFKQLKLNIMPKIGSEIEIDDTFLNKYPADVSRLVAITPNLSTQQITQQRLEKVAEDLLMEYQQLQTLFEHISVLLHGSLPSEGHNTKNRNSNKDDASHAHLPSAPTELNINSTDSSTADKNLTIDALAVNVTAQLLQDIRQIYENGQFHETWKMLTDFCAQDLSFYVHAIESRDATPPHAAYEALTQISIALLQHFAPLTPFLAEHFYRLISVDNKTDNHSIFQKNWHSVSPAIRQSLRASQTKKNDAKAEWEALRNAHNTEG
ncbi:class I tRNA ligase family protein [Candidatus Poribacteria bacterium]|nr:class I tRNA ligase family protein [Candidatus Poribacteria bacterium]